MALNAETIPLPASQRDLRVGPACGKGVHPRKAKIAGPVMAMGRHFLPLNDWECRVDVSNVVSICDAVEVEEDGIELGLEI